VEPELKDWLASQCRLIAGCQEGLLVLGSGPNAAGATCAQWPEPGAAPSAPLSATVAAALERGRICMQEPRAAQSDAVTHLALPIAVEGRLVGAVGMTLQGVGPSESKAVAGELELGLSMLRRILASRIELDRVRAMMTTTSRLLDHEGLRRGAHAFSVELAGRLGCEQVAVGWMKGLRLRIVSLSNSTRFSEESDAVRDLRDAMREAIDQDAFVALPAEAALAPIETSAHSALMRSAGAQTTCTIPLAAHGHAVGAVTFVWTAANALDEAKRRQIRELSTLCGPLIELMARADAGPLSRIRRTWSGWCDRHFGGQRLALAALAAAVAVLAVLAVVPGSYRVAARASLEGRVQRALVAAVPGYLAEANARAGDLVRAGEVLARLDDRDLQLAKRKWESRKAQLELEQREALADRDRTQVSILRAQIDQAAAELGLADESLTRTSVVAPFDGIVVVGDLDRSLGSPVEQGSVLFELAPLDGYRIIVEVDGRNIADVKPGQRGQLTLEALPDQPMPLVVERVTPVSTVADGRNYFRVEAALEEPVASLRPGMAGIAKIDAGTRRLLWIWTHEGLDWLRLRTWSWLP
jgi:RND family efflux transporter MFP subunit